jgi:hypothetical protein
MSERALDERLGASLAEALVALMLGLFLLHLGLESLARLRSAESRLLRREDALVALRVGRHVLRTELGRGRPGRDWGVEGDSLPLRAFRGVAVVCSSDSATAELVVSYRGDRAPDPAKDSVLLIGSDGGEIVRALVSTRSASGCDPGDGGASRNWELDAGVGRTPVLGRLFERGSYHLSGHALRYRRGMSGRQPLTPEVWSPSTAWSSGGARLGVDLVPQDPAAGPAWSGFLAWDGPR